jgi:hypothetical protein
VTDFFCAGEKDCLISAGYAPQDNIKLTRVDGFLGGNQKAARHLTVLVMYWLRRVGQPEIAGSPQR